MTSFHIKFYDSTLILSHLWPTSVELCYVEKNPFWQNLPTWSIFSIVKSPTSFVWTPTAQPILVGSSKTYLHAHLQTYRVHTNTSDGCSVHPSWRSCAFKIGGTFFWDGGSIFHDRNFSKWTKTSNLTRSTNAHWNTNYRNFLFFSIFILREIRAKI